eukprot:5304041-Amphidinium_carterae.2
MMHDGVSVLLKSRFWFQDAGLFKSNQNGSMARWVLRGDCKQSDGWPQCRPGASVHAKKGTESLVRRLNMAKSALSLLSTST